MMQSTGTHDITPLAAQDDAFCAALYEAYQNAPDKGEFISVEDAAAALGVEL